MRATTRFGAITPLHLAAERGAAPVVSAARQGRRRRRRPHQHRRDAADVRRRVGRHRRRSTALLDAGADVEAKERDREQTPLIFAAAANRVEAVKLLLARGANKNAATKVIDLMALSANGENPDGRNLAAKPETANGAAARGAASGRTPVPPPRWHARARSRLSHQRAGAHPGRHDAAALRRPAGLRRRGDGAARRRRRRQPAEGRRPRLGAARPRRSTATSTWRRCCSIAAPTRTWSPRTASAPLYAAINLMWAPRAGYPQPRAHLNQKVGYLDYMKKLLDKGADPNARVNKKVWYSNYNFDQSGVDETGSTAFWRAAYAADVDAMKLLMSFGADPRIPTAKPPERGEFGDAGQRVIVDVSGVPAGAGRRPRRPAAAGRRPASATARASPATRIASRRAACWPA